MELHNIADKRRSGILAHISSLPSPFGIGDLGPSAYEFLDFLQRGGQSIWQILPLNPTDNSLGNSPYMTVSSLAGNPLLLSPELLYQDGLLSSTDLETCPDFNIYFVQFKEVTNWKMNLLRKAFVNFHPHQCSDFQEYIRSANWIEDYALFMTLKKKFKGLEWRHWPKNFSRRDATSLQAFANEYSKEILYYQFLQFFFFKQWNILHQKAKDLKISLFGDIPIYVSYDSADVWANQNIFDLDPQTLKPNIVAGVPPDYFSETGQKWGNPLYLWNSRDNTISEKLMFWWTNRIQSVFSQVDIARIDHFRGFESYYSIPVDHKDGTRGKWNPGPGIQFFTEIQNRLGKLNIVAEDLGEITEAVIQLRDVLKFPGMKILQFAFDGNKENAFFPHNYDSPHCIVYTGTHDNDTTLGWFLSDKVNDKMRHDIKRSCNQRPDNGTKIHHDMIYLAMSSIARTCIIPLQDILGFGSDCRMNIPGKSEGNWQWRCSNEFLTDEISSWLYSISAQFGRTG